MDIFITVLVLISTLFALRLTKAIFQPMNRVRGLRDGIGFGHVKGKGIRKRDYINRLRKMRNEGEIPEAFPNGWYAIAESREISPGQMVHVAALGQNFAVFRGLTSPRVHVTDAYCPHLGADLTSGGRVVGDCVECPFHRWTFDGESGHCVSGPASAKAKSMASLMKWQSLEMNGVVLVWYHKNVQSPTWDPLSVDEVTNGDWVYQGRNEYLVNCHIQDISENGADPAHLDAIHSSPIFCGGEPSQWTRFLNAWAWHEWQLQWRPLQEPQGHCAELELRHNLTLLGKWSLFDLKVKARQEGPSMVHLHFDTVQMGKGVMIQYVLPLEPTLQKVVHLFYTERSWWRAYAKLVLWGESVLLERDITVWNSKKYVRQPMAGVEDGPLLRHRRWYSQFYQSTCPDLKNSGIEW